mmetsp:Transcript_10343/g.33399  ORF Transcript_10343/g.33399 Transcript_10343/m.33399 type:complete len:242 (+) Transcript_10343:205-930(+)
MAHATTALRVRCIASPLNPSAPVAPRPVTTTLIPKTKTAYGVNPAKTEAALALSKRLNAALKVAKRTTTQTKGSTSTVAAMSTWDSVDVEEGKKCLDFEEYFVLDVRSAKEYDFERLTKPTRRSQNVPAGDGFAARVASTYPKSAKLLVMCRDGVEASPAVMDVRPPWLQTDRLATQLELAPTLHLVPRHPGGGLLSAPSTSPAAAPPPLRSISPNHPFPRLPPGACGRGVHGGGACAGGV